jgi:hypothetical protein
LINKGKGERHDSEFGTELSPDEEVVNSVEREEQAVIPGFGGVRTVVLLRTSLTKFHCVQLLLNAARTVCSVSSCRTILIRILLSGDKSTNLEVRTASAML